MRALPFVICFLASTHMCVYTEVESIMSWTLDGHCHFSVGPETQNIYKLEASKVSDCKMLPMCQMKTNSWPFQFEIQI